MKRVSRSMRVAFTIWALVILAIVVLRRSSGGSLRMFP